MLPFPLPLTVNASLNRVQIAALPPGVDDADVVGKTGYGLVSSAALQAIMQAYSANQRLRLFHYLISANPETYNIGVRIATRVGRNLGILLLTLRRGDAANRAARPEWDEPYWEYWRTVGRIVVGGGMIRNLLGYHLREPLRAVFAEAQTPLPDIHIDTYGEYLPLIGAALGVPTGYKTACVLDFGGTSVKRGRAHYEDGHLVKMEAFPSIAIPDLARLSTDEVIAQFRPFVADTIAETWRQVQPDAPITPVSMAAYMDDTGNPQERQGSPYATIRFPNSSLQTWLNDEMETWLGQPIGVRLVHDGTAAATLYPDSAVVILGTAIGVGMGSSVAHPIRLHPDFRIVEGATQ